MPNSNDRSNDADPYIFASFRSVLRDARFNWQSDVTAGRNQSAFGLTGLGEAESNWPRNKG
jgi:hypothetical protein